MRIDRRLAGLAALTAVTLGTAACGNAEAGTTADAALPTPTPTATLRAAVPDASTPAFAFAAKGGCSASFTGVFDAANKAVQTSITQPIPQTSAALTMTFLAIGEDKPFIRIAFEPAVLGTRMGIPKTWLALDPDKIKNFAKSPLNHDGKTDPLGMGDLIENSSNVAQEGSKFTGTVDLTALDKGESAISSATLKKLGDEAKTVPFEAEIDGSSGKLTSLKIRIPSGKACTLTYAEYGGVKSLAAPKAKKANAIVYKMINS
ncbi:hypothetical protein QLQ12_00910 [Actinoplanes sp. NEAU-A12]|uniref:Lipoprotein n=1 Tax=Actinoplanes sandaracinus TaxID=3045177 RepID=A0ABT6WBS3_9ACTN|nr:hypothetical protein [Actinoplanes sandaracinus]MDI6097168.1 hypothetical protein [Actinoplanes sandaracinus]